MNVSYRGRRAVSETGEKSMRRTAFVVLLLFAAVVPAQAQAARRDRAADVIPGRYIVVLKGSVKSVGAKTNQLERKAGFDSRFRYRHALKGFSAKLSRRQVRQLKADPSVAAVVPDRKVHALDTLAAGDTAPP